VRPVETKRQVVLKNSTSQYISAVLVRPVETKQQIATVMAVELRAKYLRTVLRRGNQYINAVLMRPVETKQQVAIVMVSQVLNLSTACP
jgi:ribosomal protein S3AE